MPNTFFFIAIGPSRSRWLSNRFASRRQAALIITDLFIGEYPVLDFIRVITGCRPERMMP